MSRYLPWLTLGALVLLGLGRFVHSPRESPHRREPPPVRQRSDLIPQPTSIKPAAPSTAPKELPRNERLPRRDLPIVVDDDA